MNGYFITGIAAALLGAALGGGGAYTYENRAHAIEQAAHARGQRAERQPAEGCLRRSACSRAEGHR
jgi:hypothetical protein